MEASTVFSGHLLEEVEQGVPSPSATQTKWVRPKRNLAVGDIVLVASESHRNSWPLGRVVETFPDKIGFARRVKVLTKTAVYGRPVDKLCVLVENESPSTGDVDTKN